MHDTYCLIHGLVEGGCPQCADSVVEMIRYGRDPIEAYSLFFPQVDDPDAWHLKVPPGYFA